jgi:hypothetical protein
MSELNTESTPLSVNDAAEAILALSTPTGTTDEEPEQIAEQATETQEDEVAEDEETEAELEEGESEEDEEVSEEEEVTEEAEDEYVYEVTIKGENGEDEVLEVDEDELLDGYMRQRDYTRKRQTEKSEIDGLKTELEGQINELREGLSDLITDDEIKLAEYANVDWNTLKAQDANLFNEHYALALELQNRVSTNKTKLTEIKTGAQEKLNAAYETYNKDQEELVVALIPNWKTERRDIEDYLVAEGFSSKEIEQLGSAKIAVLASKARKYDDLKLKRETLSKKKIGKKVPKMVKPGSPTSAADRSSKQSKNAMSKLKSSGTLDDAAAYFLSMQ